MTFTKFLSIFFILGIYSNVSASSADNLADFSGGLSPWLHSFANARTERSRWGTNPWLNPRSERSRWGTNPWLNQRSERSRWGTNPWLRSWVIPTRTERSRWGTNPWLNQRNERSRWGTNPWLNLKSKKSPEQIIEPTEETFDDQKGKESDTKDDIEDVEKTSKRSYLWLLNPDIMT